MMRKLLGITVLLFMITNCASGTFTPGTNIWFRWASHSELVAYFSDQDLDEICHIWSVSKDWNGREKTRNAIKEVLQKQGHDKYICMKLESPE